MGTGTLLPKLYARKGGVTKQCRETIQSEYVELHCSLLDKLMEDMNVPMPANKGDARMMRGHGFTTSHACGNALNSPGNMNKDERGLRLFGRPYITTQGAHCLHGWRDPILHDPIVLEGDRECCWHNNEVPPHVCHEQLDVHVNAVAIDDLPWSQRVEVALVHIPARWN